MRLLHIDSSIRGSHSVSRQLTAAIVRKLKTEDPQIEVIYRDLVARPLPHMTFATLPRDHPSSRFSGPLDPTAQLLRNESERVLNEFMTADIVVVGAPMYNWSIPSQLKAWLDIIIVPGKTFTYTEHGPETGLVPEKRFIVAITRGVFYGQETDYISSEHTETYIRTVLSFIGVHNPEIILADGITSGEHNKTEAVKSALNAIQHLTT
jgi:FMN-dependent NADH-azoreductase